MNDCPRRSRAPLPVAPSMGASWAAYAEAEASRLRASFYWLLTTDYFTPPIFFFASSLFSAGRSVLTMVSSFASWTSSLPDRSLKTA